VRVSRRWQRRISVLAILLGLIVFVEKARSAPVHDRLMTELVQVGGERFVLNCTYAGRSAVAVTYPRYRQLAPVVYARPDVCRAANAFVRSGVVSSAAGRALLVLVHEAHHVAGVTDEALAECLALRDVGGVADRLHPGTGAALAPFVRYWHGWLVASFPVYAGAC
jgi:capsid protein